MKPDNSMNIENVEKLNPREILFFHVCDELAKFKEKNDSTWEQIALDIQNKTGISRRTIRRYVNFEIRNDGVVMPRVDSAILILSAIYPHLKYEEILKRIPPEASHLIEELRSHTNRDVSLSPEFDFLIQREPMAGIIFLMSDTKLGVSKSVVLEKLGTYGIELASKMIEQGYLTLRHTKYYATSTYPQLDAPAKAAIISQLSNSGFKNLENSEYKLSLGLYRADLSKDNYEKARSILREAYKAIGKLDQEDSQNPDISTVNCVYFHGLTILEDVSTQLIH